MRIQEILAQQRAYAASGAALEAAARVEALDRLEEGIRRREGEIYQALRADLNKPPFESYLCEVGMTLEELRFLRRHLRRWMRDVPVPTPLSQFPARSFRRPEPYGVVLILAPWNYPFLLSMQPLLGALAAGNTVVLKPSAYAPATSA
ncbi:MAG TPA: aldehyde dehydrogenase family protein, partial [Clostridiales bacterium]|nr:aldehyde dehydrogenase family protein [Clostridiales bacterium]